VVGHARARYTHYLIFLKSENTVPVWLHEGIAKFEESRWREEKRNVLSPFYETILAQALEKDGLVPIEKMHPSLALLDSAREAQLAFAQAGTSVGFLVDRWGNEGLVGLLEAMKARTTIRPSRGRHRPRLRRVLRLVEKIPRWKKPDRENTGR
jgi:hypothetical protein